MKKIIAVFAFLSLGLLVSCGNENGPEGVAKKFLEAVNKGEFDEAKKYTDEQTGQMLGMVGGMMTPEKKEEAKKKDIKVEIVSSEVKDSIATVKYKLTGKDAEGTDEKTLALKKVGDDWKVTINKEDKNKEGVPGAAAPAAPAEATDTTAVPADTVAAPAE